MPYDNPDEEPIIIDFNKRFIKGKCKAKNFKNQIEKVRGVFSAFKDT